MKSVGIVKSKVMSKKIEIVKAKRVDGIVEYYKTSIDSYFCLNGSGESNGAIQGERALTHSFLMDTLRKVMGRTLTIVDASVHDKTQNKAMKDLIRQIFSDEIEFSAEWAFDQSVLQKQAENYFKDKTDKEIEDSAMDIEDVLGVK